jgi:hypothetical protein
MGKNSRNRHKGKAAGGTRGPGNRSTVPQSLSTFRAERAVDALTPAFVRWFEEGSPDSAVTALECLATIKAVMGRYMESTVAADVTSLELADLSAAVTDEVFATADAAGAAAGELDAFERSNIVIDAVHAFVGFLVETGRWTGTVDQLAELVDFFDANAAGDGGQGHLEVPEIPQEQALEAFSNLPLIQRATALLQWVGKGKPVTGTGALRIRDIEAAAACVGVAARGGTIREDSPLPVTTGPADKVPTVRSMYEVPLLALLWNVLEATELIEIKSTKVVPSADSAVFLAGRSSERLEELVFFVDQFLVAAVLEWDPAQPWERIVSGLQASILLAAATSDPPEKARVLAAPDNAPEAEKAMAGILTQLAVDRLDDLAELGLVTIDTHFRVPPALIRCVANVFDDDWVLADLGLNQVPDAAGEEPVAQSPAVSEKGAVPAARQDETPILQLKIMLTNSKPPIWRRVLLPAGMPLPQLHQVIQTLFGWFDYHLHQFQIGGFRGPTYAPAAGDGEDHFYGQQASLDEAQATVGDLLTAVGSNMSYTYDFGDNWVHAIKVEKILAPDDVRQLPRCTAGRGAAPAEDSGGTSGWANVVQAVNDPHHEDHEEYREWLGLLPGDTLDPKAFDVDEANEELAGLF